MGSGIFLKELRDWGWARLNSLFEVTCSAGNWD